MPSLLSPKASSWLSPVPRVAGSNPGACDHIGSPHLATTRQPYPSGTVTVSRPFAATGSNPKRFSPASATAGLSAPAAATNAAAPKVAVPPKNPRRDSAFPASRAKSVSNGRGERISSNSSKETLCVAAAPVSEHFPCNCVWSMEQSDCGHPIGPESIGAQSGGKFVMAA